jgi:hypothetical protein
VLRSKVSTRTGVPERKGKKSSSSEPRMDTDEAVKHWLERNVLGSEQICQPQHHCCFLWISFIALLAKEQNPSYVQGFLLPVFFMLFPRLGLGFTPFVDTSK